MRRLRRDLDAYELTRMLPAAGVLTVWAVLMFRSGGYRPGTWLPAGIVLLGLLAVAIVGSGQILPPAPARRPLQILIAFTAWCYLSLLWSDAPGTALEAANLLLLALAGAWTLSLAPWKTRTAAMLMLAFSAAAATACLAALLSALGTSDLTSRFEDFRFAPPLDYPNATAAFAFMAALPALLLAARPDASIPAKASGQGLATFLCAYALLPQSRGSILGGLATIAVLAFTVPFRWRLTLHALLLAATTVAVAGPVGDVYTAASSGTASGALGDALTAMLVAVAAGVAAGIALAVAEDRVQFDDERQRLARLGGFVLAGVCVVSVLGVGIAKSASISDTLSDQWRSLKHPGVDYGGTRANDAGGRLTSADPLERYDYWRVSLDGFRSNPLGGLGAGGFEHRYTIERRYPKPSRYPHNVVMKVVGDTGIVGVGLILAFLVLAVRGLALGTRRAPARARLVTATALAMLAYFVAHGLFDWLEAYPVLTGPALGFPLVALVVAGRAHTERRRRLEGATPAEDVPAGLPALAVTGVVLLLAFACLLGPWLSLRYRDRASETWRTDAGLAYADLDRAADLDPLDAQAHVLKGVIATTRGDTAIAQAGFRQALDREDTWLPHFGLAALAADSGDRALAKRELAAARRLNRRDAVLPGIAAQILSKRGLAPDAAIRLVLTNSYADREKVS